MSRIAWILLSAAAALLFLGFAGAAFVIASSSGSEASDPETTVTLGEPRSPLELPLSRDDQALTFAARRGRHLVAIAARPGASVEIAVVKGEEPVSSSELSFEVGNRPVTATSCGRACSRLDVKPFNGARSITVKGPFIVAFALPQDLPPSGARLFRRVDRAMGSLRSYRFRESLTSGVGEAPSSVWDARAPNRMKFRTADGFQSIIIGRARWDLRDGTWERSTFPGLRVPTYMWDGARNARLLGKTRFRGRPVQILSVYDREPIHAWFRLLVDAQNRVVDAHMIAPSHFMSQQFSNFNGPIVIRPPA